MKRITTLFLLFPLLAGPVAPVYSAPPLEVLYDSGDTVPLAPLLQASGLDTDEPVQPPPATDTQPLMSRALTQRAVIRSPGLRPGVQARRPTGKAGAVLPRPLFLVGADETSLAWLREHRKRLKHIGAVGLIVQAGGEADIAVVRAAADGLQLAAGSGAMLAEHFGITHYPVLIGPEWIEQ